jgi:hypothetical protein
LDEGLKDIMSATTRDALHQLIDELAEADHVLVEAYLRRLVHGPATASTPDELLAFLEAAPFDDEPTSPEEDADADEALEEYRRGEFITSTSARLRLLG